MENSTKSNKKAASRSLDATENENLSPKKFRLSVSEEAKVGTSLQAIPSTSAQQIPISQFNDYMSDEFKDKYKELLAAFHTDTEGRNALYAKAFQEQSEGRAFLMTIFDRLDEIFKEFLRAKVFLMTLFSSEFTSDELKSGQEFCSSFNAEISFSVHGLDIEKEIRKAVPGLLIGSSHNMRCEYLIFVNFFIRNSNNIFGLFISAHDVQKTLFLNYFDLFEKFSLFLDNRKNNIQQLKAAMGKDDDLTLLIRLNSALEIFNEQLDALLYDFSKM